LSRLAEVAAYTTAAGLAIPAGGPVALIEPVQPQSLEQELRHGNPAFGGGVIGLLLLAERVGTTAIVMGAATRRYPVAFQDIATQAHLQHHRARPLGAVLRLGPGLVGHVIIGG
jgi:hypothetical protein